MQLYLLFVARAEVYESSQGRIYGVYITRGETNVRRRFHSPLKKTSALPTVFGVSRWIRAEEK